MVPVRLRFGEAGRTDSGGFVDSRTNFLPTPSQTVGPYFGIALPWPDGPRVVPEGTVGAFWIRGRVTDGAGDQVPDAMVETWQADPAGNFPSERDDRTAGFRGFGRCATDTDGGFGILTVKPGAVPGVDGTVQAPHIDVAVFARGLLRPVITRIYFPDEPSNDEDPLLTSVPDPDRATMLASRTEDGYRFDIRLQGDGETAFFDL
jgi:protocatechuate 3,4-dioxygenase alpha subunit